VYLPSRAGRGCRSWKYGAGDAGVLVFVSVWVEVGGRGHEEGVGEVY
jgi:hypothetical protein